MEITLNKETIQEIIRDYYRKHEGVDVDVNISTTVEKTEYFCNSSYYAKTKVEVSRNMVILGHNTSVKESLTIDDVKSIFETVLEKEEKGYTLKSLSYDDGYNKKYTDLFEDVSYEPYFKGIKLIVDKNKVKKIGAK